MTGWTVVVPVKSVALAKSRLRPLDPLTRAILAQAFALDAIASASRARTVGRVIVVGRPDELALIDPRAEVLPEPPGSGLHAAIAAGVARAREDASGPTAVMLGDLPALAPAHLDRALDEASHHRLSFVVDAHGSGTTLAAANTGQPFPCHFGADSAARHRRAGFVDLVAKTPSAIALALRTDVDTTDDLEAAIRIGPAARTARALRRLSIAPRA